MLLGARIGSWFKRSSPEPTPTGRTVAKYLQYIDIGADGTARACGFDTGFVIDSATKGFKIGIRKTSENITDGMWCMASCYSDITQLGFCFNEDYTNVVSLYQCDFSDWFLGSDEIYGYCELTFNYKNDGKFTNGGGQSFVLGSGDTPRENFITGASVIVGYSDTMGGAIRHMTEFVGTDGDDIVCDIVPVIDSNDTVCLYDKISRRFIDSFIGTPVAGPELPYDSLVEWVESDGTAFIDTGISFANETFSSFNFDIETTFSISGVPASTINLFRFGASPRQSTCVYITNDDFSTRYPTVSAVFDFDQNDVDSGKLFTIRLTHDSSSGSVFYNGELVRTISTTATVIVAGELVGVKLFGDSVYSGGYMGGGITRYFRVKSFQATNKKSGSSFSGIACVKDNMAYFYDRVTGNLYGNSAGAGALLYGDRID